MADAPRDLYKALASRVEFSGDPPVAQFSQGASSDKLLFRPAHPADSLPRLFQELTWRRCTVELVGTELVNTITVGSQSVAEGGATRLSTEDRATRNVAVGVEKIAGFAVGAAWCRPP